MEKSRRRNSGKELRIAERVRERKRKKKKESNDSDEFIFFNTKSLCK